MIVTLPFVTMYVCDATDPDDGMWWDSLDSFDQTDETSIEYRPTAAGTVRAFVPAFDRRTFQASAVAATAAEHQWLKDHRARHLLFRFRDVRVFGMYERYHAYHHKPEGLFQIELAVTEVDYVEAV